MHLISAADLPPGHAGCRQCPQQGQGTWRGWGEGGCRQGTPRRCWGLRGHKWGHLGGECRDSGCEPTSHGPTYGLPAPDSDPGTSPGGFSPLPDLTWAKGPAPSASPGAHPAGCDHHRLWQPTASTKVPDVPAGTARHGTVNPAVPGAGRGTDEAAVAGNETGWKGAGCFAAGEGGLWRDRAVPGCPGPALGVRPPLHESHQAGGRLSSLWDRLWASNPCVPGDLGDGSCVC